MWKSGFHGRALALCSQAYLSILYLKPRTQIILRGKKNIPRLITKGLNNIEHDVYNPLFSVSLIMEGNTASVYCVGVNLPDTNRSYQVSCLIQLSYILA